MLTRTTFSLIPALGLVCALALGACSDDGATTKDAGADIGGIDLRADTAPHDGPATDSAADSAADSAVDLTPTLDLRGVDSTSPDSTVVHPDLGGLPCPTDLTPTIDDRAAYTAVLACLADTGAPAAAKRATIDAFVTLVEARGGFPIVAAGKVVFVYVDAAKWDVEDDEQTAEDYDPARRKPPLRVAGTFNGWNAGAGADALQSAGEGFYHLETTISGASGTARHRYKYVAKDGAGDVWFSDPLARRFGYDGNGRYALIRGGDNAQGKGIGHLEWIRDVPSALLGGVSRRIYVYVPRNYDQPASAAKRYPVLYLHDGNNAFDPLQPFSNGSWDADGVADLEIDAGNIKELIIVGIPNNADRMNEYTHTQDIISAGGQPLGGKGDQYVDYIVQELKPVIDKRYRTLPGKDDTAVLGSSLGGLISFHAGLRHPKVFKYVGGMSSTFNWGRFGMSNDTVPELYAKVSGLVGRQQVYYLDSGGNPPCPPSGSNDNYCDTKAFHAQLVGQGINVQAQDPNSWPLTPTNVNLYYHHEPGAGHNEAAWNKRLYRPLRLFFPK